MLRRLHPEQPDSFAFTPANREWAEAQISKYPEGRQASAIIPLLWRAQEQEGWLTRPAIEHVCDMLGMAHIRGLEVATFYFMFQLQPVGSVAHIQVCGTTSCMICGAEDLIAVCKEKIARRPHELSADGKLSWEEVECLGACANAPMAQIGKDYYEDLTAESFGRILDDLRAGKVPAPGPQNGRYAAEPAKGLTSLAAYDTDRGIGNGSVALAKALGDTVKRIDGTEVPLLAPWRDKGAGHHPGAAANIVAAPRPRPAHSQAPKAAKPAAPEPAEPKAAKPKSSAGKDRAAEPAAPYGAAAEPRQPETLDAPRGGQADDLKKIKGVGPKLEKLLNDLGFWHFDQIAAWGPEEIAWVDERLTFKGRIERDDWVGKAAALARTG